MTSLPLLLLLLFLAAAAVAACTGLYLIARARNKRLLLASMRGTSCDAPNGIGISVLCSGVSGVEQVENLLSVGYSRYEVVVVLDAQLCPAAFAELVARYRMIRVEWAPTGELPADGVRAVGRSRKRCYRRLVLVDRAHDDRTGDFDAAASVAAYDNLLPVDEGWYLLPGAVERLVAELGERPAGELELVQSRIGEPVRLLAREAVIGAGGFAGKPWRGIPRGRRRTLWEPLLVRPAARRAWPRRLWIPASVLFISGIAFAITSERWILTAVLLTATLVWIAAGYAAQLLAAIPGTKGLRLFPNAGGGVK